MCTINNLIKLLKNDEEIQKITVFFSLNSFKKKKEIRVKKSNI